MLIILRSVAIIDSSLVKVSNLHKIMRAMPIHTVQNAAIFKAQENIRRSFSAPALKRKVGYMLDGDDDDEESAATKVGKMSIDD